MKLLEILNRLYKYNNKKLIEILYITLDEQQQLITIISGKEKYRRCAEEKKAKQKAKRRNEKGLTKKQQEIENLKEKIIKLKNEGSKNKEISDKLSISLKTLERYITKMRSEGRL